MKDMQMILAFQLTMPKVGSWNGIWTGENAFHFQTRIVDVDRAKRAMDKSFLWDFGDGWVAQIDCVSITESSKRKLDECSAGFCGYEWMIDSIVLWGVIRDQITIGEIKKLE